MENVLQPAQWVNNYAAALYAYTMARINDKGMAEDIVQETFFNAWKAKDTYKGMASEKTWLYTICKNKIIDHYRKASSAKIKVAKGEEDFYFDTADHWADHTEPGQWDIDYSQPVEKKEFYIILDRCKQKLKEVQQTVFVMKYMEELDADEICKVLDLTPSYYWVLIHRAKLHLRSCLEKNWINKK